MSLVFQPNKYNFNCSTPIAKGKQRTPNGAQMNLNSSEVLIEKREPFREYCDAINTRKKEVTYVPDSFSSVSSIENPRRQKTNDTSKYDSLINIQESFLTKVSSVRSNALKYSEEDKPEVDYKQMYLSMCSTRNVRPNSECDRSIIDDEEQLEKMLSLEDGGKELNPRILSSLEFEYNYNSTRNNVDVELSSYYTTDEEREESAHKRSLSLSVDHSRVQRWVDSQCIYSGSNVCPVNVSLSEESVEEFQEDEYFEMNFTDGYSSNKAKLIAKYKESQRKIIIDEDKENSRKIDKETLLFNYRHRKVYLDEMDVEEGSGRVVNDGMCLEMDSGEGRKGRSEPGSSRGDAESWGVGDTVIYDKLSGLLRENMTLREMLATNRMTNGLSRGRLREVEEKLSENVRRYNEFIGEVERSINDLSGRNEQLESDNCRLNDIVVDSTELLTYLYRQIPDRRRRR